MSHKVIDLDTLVVPTFRAPISAIINASARRVVLKGGRNTTKSQVTSEAIILGCMKHKRSAIAIVRYGNKIQERLVNTFSESLNYLGLSSLWKLRKSPLEYVLLDSPGGRETNISIKFAGADNPDSLKSYKPRSGSFLYIWIEEVTNFPSRDEVDNIVITMARGSGAHLTIYTFNPPKSIEHWCNTDYAHTCGKALGYSSNMLIRKSTFKAGGMEFVGDEIIHHSTYLDIIPYHPDWLGQDFLARVASYSSDKGNLEYRRTFLGDTVAGEANVFTNVKALENIASIVGNTQVLRGMDMSNGGNDPYRYVQCCFDRKSNSLFIWNEIDLNPTTSIQSLASKVSEKNPHNFPVYTDSAVPTFITQLQGFGVNAVPVKKWPDSVNAGMQWLRSLSNIYIDPNTAPATLKELKSYEYKVSRGGIITGEYPDSNNHGIDAVRYACVYTIRN